VSTGLEPARPGTDARAGCHRLARVEGLAPALALLRAAVLPGLLPCGPAGHAVVPADVVFGDGIWLDGVTSDRAGSGTQLGGFDLPGGRVAVHQFSCAVGGAVDEHERAAWALGLVWLRLGLSEALRETCLRYLRTRRTGDSVLVRQQLVKGALAEAVANHLEIRAVLIGAGAGGLPYPALSELHARITMTDRAQLRLLGASGFLVGSPGEVAHVSELVADAYRTGSAHEQA
jgi:hypothetical protein